MSKIITIIDGQGSIELVNGQYAVNSSTIGYDDVSITPSSQEIVEGTNDYAFAIAATGTLTFHVSDDGTNTGTPIEGATFERCDSTGTIYGETITSGTDGNAVFNFVPFATENAPIIYYKQTASDGNHIFQTELQNTTLTTQTYTIEVENSPAPTRNFTLTDTNYSGLPIADGQIVLNN